MTKKKAAPPNFPCPDCTATYAFAKGLSSHRRAAHGYVSQTAQAVKTRAKKTEAEADAALLLRNVAVYVPAPTLRCPDCDHVAATLQALIWHRKKEHGYVGKRGHRDEPDLSTPSEAALLNPLQCPQCSFVAQFPGGLRHHLTRKHGAEPVKPKELKRRTLEPSSPTKLTVTKTNGAIEHHHAEEESHTPSDGIPEATLALALGRFQGLCTSIAYEFDLPPRLFAARLAGLIYRSTLR